MSGINIPDLKRQYSTDSSYGEQKILDMKADSSWEPGTILTDGVTSRRVYVTDEEKKLLNMSEKEAKSRLKEAKRRARENMNKTLKQNIEEFMKNPKAKNKTKKKGGKKKRSYKRRKRRRRSHKRGGMKKSIQPGLMQDWTGILDPQDALKAHLIDKIYLPKEMKPLTKNLIDQIAMQQMEGQNLINDEEQVLKYKQREAKKLHDRINPSGKKTWTGSKNDPMVKEIYKLWAIDKNIERIKGNISVLKDRQSSLDMELKRLKQSLSDDGKGAKYVGSKKIGTRRLKGGKKKKKRRKKKTKKRK